MKSVLIGIVAYLLCMGLCIGIFAFVSIKCIQRRDTRNFDGGMRNFIYKIPMPEKQALERASLLSIAFRGARRNFYAMAGTDFFIPKYNHLPC